MPNAAAQCRRRSRVGGGTRGPSAAGPRIYTCLRRDTPRVLRGRARAARPVRGAQCEPGDAVSHPTRVICLRSLAKACHRASHRDSARRSARQAAARRYPDPWRQPGCAMQYWACRAPRVSECARALAPRSPASSSVLKTSLTPCGVSCFRLRGSTRKRAHPWLACSVGDTRI